MGYKEYIKKVQINEESDLQGFRLEIEKKKKWILSQKENYWGSEVVR